MIIKNVPPLKEKTSLRKWIVDEIGNNVVQVNIPAEWVTDPGQETIRYYMRENGLAALPADWDWTWLITHRGNKFGTGTLPKRIGNYFYKERAQKVSPTHLARIGEIARMHTDKRKVYYVDFDTTLNWERGAFGDYESCFWGDRHSARDILVENEAYALRFWLEHEAEAAAFTHGTMEMTEFDVARYSSRSSSELARYRRVAEKKDDLFSAGRCWLVPDFPNMGMAVMFNSYPKNFLLVRSARILATLLGYNYSRVGLENHGSSSGTVYINGGTAYCVHPFGSVVGNYDLEFDNAPIGRCYICGDNIFDDSRYRTFSLDPDDDDQSGFVCADHRDRIEECSHCGRLFLKTMMITSQQWSIYPANIVNAEALVSLFPRGNVPKTCAIIASSDVRACSACGTPKHDKVIELHQCPNCHMQIAIDLGYSLSQSQRGENPVHNLYEPYLQAPVACLEDCKTVTKGMESALVILTLIKMGAYEHGRFVGHEIAWEDLVKFAPFIGANARVKFQEREVYEDSKFLAVYIEDGAGAA